MSLFPRLSAVLVLVLMLPNVAPGEGACTAARFHDWKDMGCDAGWVSAGGPAKEACPPCDGMPRWWVSEPYVNLSIADTPLSYRLSSGERMDFSFHYRQRVKRPNNDEISGVLENHMYDVYPGMANDWGSTCGKNASWFHSWELSVTVWDPEWEKESQWRRIDNTYNRPTWAPYSGGYQAIVWRAQGGIQYFNVTPGVQNSTDKETGVRITGTVSGQDYPVVLIGSQPTPDASGIYWGEEGKGLKLVYPDGSEDIFSLCAYAIGQSQFLTVKPGSSDSRLFLTRRVDARGRVTRLGYERHSAQSAYLRLRYVVDSDGRTNTFRYSTGLQLSEIEDPYGRKTRVTHTPLGFMLSGLASIVDAAGLTNTFTYQGDSGWITSMNTPYGQTRFNYYYLTDPSVTDGYQKRAICVSEPEGAQQLYLYQHQNGGFVAATETAPTVPGHSFDNGTSGTTGHQALTYRNTFHWGRRQYEALRSNTTFTNAMGNSFQYQEADLSVSEAHFAAAIGALSQADYNKAALKHWLLGTNALSITSGLSSRRDPSPDSSGSIPGLRTWYNYKDKPSAEILGPYSQVSCEARLLPGGQSEYTAYEYHSGPPGPGPWFVSKSRSSYTRPDGTTGVLTNWFHYSLNGVDLLVTSNSAGQSVSRTYNGSHQVTFATNALGEVTAWSYGSGQKVTAVVGPSGRRIDVAYYGEHGMPSQLSFSPEGRVFNINSYVTGLPAAVSDDRGLSLSYTWDGLNRLTGISFPDNTSISNVYHRLDRVGVKDRLNHWRWYSFDGLQHITAATNENNAVTTYNWCGCGSLSSVVDALTNATVLGYDNQGKLTNVLFADASSISWKYDLAGRMTNVADGANRALSVAYNIQGLPTRISTVHGVLRETIYDALNRPVSVTDANGVTVSNRFDSLNRLLSRSWPDGIGEGFGYTASGLVSYTNRNGKVTRYARDEAGRVTAVTNANLEVTRVEYESRNHPAWVLDGLLHQTTWQYNEYGLLTNKVDGLNRDVERFAYNANGWVTNRWTPEKGNTGYTFDDAGNLRSIIHPERTLEYLYDALNRLTNMVDAVGSTAFTYTPSGRWQSEDGPWAEDTVTRGYTQGLRTGLSLAGPSTNWVQSYDYDASWRLRELGSPAGPFTYDYQFAGASPLVTTLALPNGAKIQKSYDDLARLAGTALNNYWGHTLDGYVYRPDAVGLRTNIARNFGMGSSTVKTAFDDIGQLTEWNAFESDTTPRQHEQLGFGFDAAGNLQTRQSGGLIETFGPNAANELIGLTRSGTLTLSGNTPAPATNVTVNGLAAETYGDLTFARTNVPWAPGANTFTNIAQNAYGLRATNVLKLDLPSSSVFAYDLNGNLTNDGVHAFSYDAFDQLTSVTVVGSWKREFVHDGLGRRRVTRDYEWEGGAWVLRDETRLICDGRLPIQERDANNNVLVTYTRGLDLSGTLQGAGGIGGLLARTDANGSAFYHSDGSGNVTSLIDGRENIVARYLYSPFGQLLGMWGPMAQANHYRFSSKEQIAPDLYDYGLRVYHPGWQRWLTKDPIGEAGGLNLYEFVQNNPVNRIDPWGLTDASGLEGLWPQASSEASAGIGMVVASMIPGVGEVMDMMVLDDPESMWWEKGLAGLSLALSAVTDGFSPNAGGFLKAGKKCKEALKELPSLRQQYVDAVTALAGKVSGLRQAGKSSEEIARLLHAERRILGEQFKALTPDDKLAEITARNIKRYGDPLGPTIDWLRARGKSWEDIIESATRPGGTDLGF